jgi:uncharacterized membrane protein YoaT (DUF817 family)
MREGGVTDLPGLLRDDPVRSRPLRALVELLAFAWHQSWACLFAVFIFACLGLTKQVPVPGFPRYDLLLVLCLLFQAWMLRSGRETRDELKVICLFHALGLAMELWKVRIGSWSYPGEAWTMVGGVPLFSGFMYASVASYACQAWRRLRLRLHRWPRSRHALAVSAAIYGNFFANAFLPDLRWALFGAAALLFGRSWISFVPNGRPRSMPTLAAFGLVGFFIWLAEQLATFLGAWRYPNQHHGWKPVYLQKLSSWALLVIVSIVLVAELKRLKARGIRGGILPAPVTPSTDDRKAFP